MKGILFVLSFNLYVDDTKAAVLRYSGSPNMDHSDVSVQAIDDNLACHHSGYRKLSGHAILLNYPLVNKSCTMESVAFTAEKVRIQGGKC